MNRPRKLSNWQETLIALVDRFFKPDEKEESELLDTIGKSFVGSEDPYYDLCFRHLDPLDDEFAKIAMKVFKPVLEHSKEIRLE